MELPRIVALRKDVRGTRAEKPARARNIMSGTRIEEGATHMRSMFLEHGQFRIVGVSGRDNFVACFDVLFSFMPWLC